MITTAMEFTALAKQMVYTFIWLQPSTPRQVRGLHIHIFRVCLLSIFEFPTDIPLVPCLGGSGTDKGFVVHWLNNKEMHFTLQAEYILQACDISFNKLFNTLILINNTNF